MELPDQRQFYSLFWKSCTASQILSYSITHTQSALASSSDKHETIKITDCKVLIGRFDWTGNYKKGYIRVNRGKPQKMLKLAFDTSYNRMCYRVTDMESQGCRDYQHNVIEERTGVFFFPTDDIGSMIDKTLYILGSDCDVLVKVENTDDRRCYKCFYASGLECLSPFPTGRLHPPRIRKIQSDTFTLPEVYIVGDGNCVICKRPISEDQLESLECGHHFHANCLVGSIKFSYDDICCPHCWRRSV